ncbi:MAG: DUF4349 domain-containing protein [Flavobacteriales bacterium]
MRQDFKTRFKKISRWFAIIFILLFAFRLIYGYIEVDSSSNERNALIDNFSSVNNTIKNYATEKIKNDQISDLGGAMGANQKYEKTATINSKSTQFDKDEELIKAKSSAFNAVIQYEQNLGQEGNRQIHLLIGVNPELFDSLYNELKQIGELKGTVITKVDKTNEYRELNAQKASIESSLQSLLELKSKGGSIADFIKLNEKILETEERAQNLGVELGNFDTVNEFCTVKLSMYEGEAEKKISFLHRVKVALEWTLSKFLMFVVTVFFVSLSVGVLLWVLDKFNLLKSLVNRDRE